MPKLLLALAFGVLLSVLRPGAEGRNPSYGVKLCGREFIRAVIFTCGGSRWRRTGDLDILSGPPAGEDSVEATSSEWDPSHLPAILPHQEFSSDYHERRRGKPDSWPLERTVRDVTTGLSTSCCKWGCSKSEISSLC
ncbi:relaxin-3 [Carettochelys insculpta]|uniref:relaxin-3 n=1 Tax=Carettochelys insculpta TaxID=44489 RepID=UPI003EB9CA97